jgi:LPS export ABC transporter permease LptG
MRIDRYVFREIVGPTMLGILVFQSLLVVHRLFVLADQWVNGTLTLLDIGKGIAYLQPSFLILSLPMAVLWGVLVAFSRLSADSEITALRTCGVSWYRLLVPTLTFALLALAVSLATYLWLVPGANSASVEMQIQSMNRADLNREIRPGTWVPLQEGAADADFALFARGVDDSDPDKPWLTGVDILQVDHVADEARHYAAGRARIERVTTGEDVGRLMFVFRDLRSIFWKPNDPDTRPTINETPSGWQLGPEKRTSTDVPHIERRRIDKNVKIMTLDELKGSLEDLAQMDRVDALIAAHPEQAKELRASMPVYVAPIMRDRLRRLIQLEIHKKFALPVACLVLAAVAMPLGIATRRGGRPASFLVALCVVAIWYTIFEGASAQAIQGRISPALGAWLADLVIGLAALHLLVSQRRRQGVGLFRALADATRVGGIILMVLGVLLWWERHARAEEGGSGAQPPAWPFVAGISLLVMHLLLRRFRDPISLALARILEAFRRPSPGGFHREADRPPMASADAPSSTTGIDGAMLKHVARLRARLLRKDRLLRVRNVFVLGLLAMVGLTLVSVTQSEDGPMAGLREAASGWQAIALGGLVLGCLALQVTGVGLLSVLDWWILKLYVRTFAVVGGAMYSVYLIIVYVELAPSIAQNGVAGATIVAFIANLTPKIVFELAPYAAMGTVLVTFGMLTKFNEITALRVGGISVYRAAFPTLVVSLMIAFGAFVLHDSVLPRTNARAADLRHEIQKGSKPVARTGPRGFLLGQDGHSLYQYRIFDQRPSRTGVASAKITHLTVLRQDAQGRVQDLWSAKDAIWQGQAWVLHAGWHATIDLENHVTMEKFVQSALPGMETPDYFASTLRDPNLMAFAEFRRYVEDQAAAGFPTGKLRVDLQKKIAYPAASFVLVLLALPLAFTTGRRGALYGLGICLILAVVYWVALAFFTALGSADYLPPVVAAWGPNVIFALGGIYGLLHVRT